MACPQCCKRLLSVFIHASAPFGTVTQRHCAAVSNLLPLSHVRRISNTQSRRLQSSGCTASQTASAEAIFSTSDTVSPPESASSLAPSAGESDSHLHNIKSIKDSIRKELYEYLEARGVDTELLKPRLESLPISPQFPLDSKANSYVSIEPDWRQISGKNPRKKARDRYRNDLARLTGQAPLYHKPERKVESSQDQEMSLELKSRLKGLQAPKPDSHLKESSGNGSTGPMSRGNRRERDEARMRLRVKLKRSTKLEGKEEVKHTKRVKAANMTQKDRRISQSGSDDTKEMPVWKGRDSASTAVKSNGTSRPSISKSGPRPPERHPNKNKEHWQIDKAAVKAKIGGARWDPKKKLSPDAREGIRTLNAQYPDKFTTPVLAKHFEVSPEAIRRILKSKWKPSAAEEEQRQERWDRRGEKIWTDLVAKGVNPPKKWRDMGIIQGQRATQRRTSSSDYTSLRKGNASNLSGQSTSEWVASVPGRMR